MLIARSSIWILWQWKDLAWDIAAGACCLARALVFVADECTAILCHVTLHCSSLSDIMALNGCTALATRPRMNSGIACFREFSETRNMGLMTKELMAESDKKFPEMITSTYLIVVQYSSK